MTDVSPTTSKAKHAQIGRPSLEDIWGSTLTSALPTFTNTPFPRPIGPNGLSNKESGSLVENEAVAKSTILDEDNDSWNCHTEPLRIKKMEGMDWMLKRATRAGLELISTFPTRKLCGLEVRIRATCSKLGSKALQWVHLKGDSTKESFTSGKEI